MKFETSELDGVALAWAVAKAEGRADKRLKLLNGTECQPFAYVKHPDGKGCTLAEAQFLFDFDTGGYYHPHTSWGFGGPIIEREKIQLLPSITKCEQPWHSSNPANDYVSHQYGPTPLIAAMRCYVAGKLGDTVEVPDTLE